MVQKRKQETLALAHGTSRESIAKRGVIYSFAWKAAIASTLVPCLQRKSATASDCHVHFQVHLA